MRNFEIYLLSVVTTAWNVSGSVMALFNVCMHTFQGFPNARWRARVQNTDIIKVKRVAGFLNMWVKFGHSLSFFNIFLVFLHPVLHLAAGLPDVHWGAISARQLVHYTCFVWCAPLVLQVAQIVSLILIVCFKDFLSASKATKRQEPLPYSIAREQ